VGDRVGKGNGGMHTEEGLHLVGNKMIVLYVCSLTNTNLSIAMVGHVSP
jgi:hypothetical protein